MTAERVDVLIVGAGLVGTAAALLYANGGYRVLLADNRAPLRSVAGQPDGLNLRTVALAHRSVQLMREAGIWQLDVGCPINAIHVSERGRFGAVRLRAEEFGLQALGLVVANQELEQQLLAAATQHSNVRLEYGWTLERITERSIVTVSAKPRKVKERSVCPPIAPVRIRPSFMVTIDIR